MEGGKPWGLSDSYWASLSDFGRTLYEVIRPQAKAVYEVDVQLGSVESFLANLSRDMASMGGTLELDPDFQRGHVWTDEQRVQYVQSLLRGCAPRSILFNCPGWNAEKELGDIPAHTFQCIDGLQRLTAVRKFMAGEFRVFGDVSAEDLKGTPFAPSRYTLKMSVFEFANRRDLLQYYLDLNSGGTVHSAEEIQRVRKLRDKAAAPKAKG
ncbi:DUF262 domain-containing protein [Ralstonia sp. ASV6]|uniref:DUF262 domain-containing protein n=1 Tax=Ralstonia sp. ASV6 TaxID=2795124 RepID=UPI0018EC4E09|nr:DUF262 domain-containing protein [Ralstonia sp. ASV6]